MAAKKTPKTTKSNPNEKESPMPTKSPKHKDKHAGSIPGPVDLEARAEAVEAIPAGTSSEERAATVEAIDAGSPPIAETPASESSKPVEALAQSETAVGAEMVPAATPTLALTEAPTAPVPSDAAAAAPTPEVASTAPAAAPAPTVSPAEVESLRAEVERAQTQVTTAEEEAKRIVAEAKAKLREARDRYRDRCREAGALPAAEGRTRGANVTEKVSFHVTLEGEQIRIALKGKPESEERLSLETVRSALTKSAYSYCDRHIGPKEVVGNKGGTLTNKLRALLATLPAPAPKPAEK